MSDIKPQDDILDEELLDDEEGNLDKPTRAYSPRIRKINLELVHKQLLNTLARDVRHLFIANLKKPLGDEDSKKLINYLKLLKEIRKSVTAHDLEKMSDAELEKLAAKSNSDSEKPDAG